MGQHIHYDGCHGKKKERKKNSFKMISNIINVVASTPTTPVVFSTKCDLWRFKHRQFCLLYSLRHFCDVAYFRNFLPNLPCSPPIWKKSWSEWLTDAAARTKKQEKIMLLPFNFLCDKWLIIAPFTQTREKRTHWSCWLHTYQLIIVDNHQLDVLGLSLDGALASPHLEETKQNPQRGVWVCCHCNLHTR